jgi:hypothetical protein
VRAARIVERALRQEPERAPGGEDGLGDCVARSIASGYDNGAAVLRGGLHRATRDVGSAGRSIDGQNLELPAGFGQNIRDRSPRILGATGPRCWIEDDV